MSSALYLFGQLRPQLRSALLNAAVHSPMHRSAWSLPPDDEFGAERIAAAQASHHARLAAMSPRTHTHPPPRDLSHLTARRKKAEVAFERASEIEHANLLLVQRLRTIVARKQIDNVASVMSQLPRSLNRQKRTAELSDIVRENARIYARIAHTKPRVQRAAAIAREAAELEAVISRHCEKPRLDPLAFQRSYYADQRNPFLNFSGGKIKSKQGAEVRQQTPMEEKHEESEQLHSQSQQHPQSQHQTQFQQSPPTQPPQPIQGDAHRSNRAGSLLFKPTRPQSAAPPRHAASARPGSARPTLPLSHAAPAAPTDPLLLARPVSARFRPLRMEQNPIALAKHVAELQAQAAAANRARRPPPRPASAAGIAASHSARAAQPAAASTPSPSLVAPPPAAHLLFSGPWLISGRLAHLRMQEHTQPWRIEIAVTDTPATAAAAVSAASPPPAPSPTEYTLLLDSSQLAPFFSHEPDIFSGSARSRAILVSALKDSLKFVRMSELQGCHDATAVDESDDSFELCVDLVQSAPKPLSPRVGSVMQEFEAVKRAAAHAREQQRLAHRPDDATGQHTAAEKLRQSVAAKPWSIQQLTAMLPTTTEAYAENAQQQHAHAVAAPSPAHDPTAACSSPPLAAPAATPSPAPAPTAAPSAALAPAALASRDSRSNEVSAPPVSPPLPPSEPVIVIPTHHPRHSRFRLTFTPAAATAAVPVVSSDATTAITAATADPS